MTEAEWLACADPTLMLAFLRDKAGDRKLRLFACACCRRIWHLLTDERSRRAVEAGEEVVDARTNSDRHALRVARKDAMNAERDSDALPARAARSVVARSAYEASWRASRFAALAAPNARRDIPLATPEVQAELAAQTSLLREIAGPLPFRPVTLNPAWLTPTVKQLAQAIYHEKAFERLPILADALEDSGCTNADILNHCRQPGEHVRGCWVVDLILGKE
jgi:hypothetical protein